MSWQAIRGHDAVIRSFTAAAQRNRLGHAYLFVGPAGVGKRLLARELAKTLLCETPRAPFGACDQCDSCALVDAETHPDFFQVSRPEDVTDLPIEAIRELTGNLALKPARGGRKIAILDDTVDLNEASANAFLKLLEEPPPHSMLILIGGTSADHHLPTIVSRCQVIRFTPLSNPVLRQLLVDRGVTEPARQERLLRLSGGSLGQALALQDEALWQFRERLLEGFAAERIESVALARAWMRFLEESAKEGAGQRRTAAAAIKLLIDILESALRIALGVETPADDREGKFLQQLAQRVHADRLMAWIERACEADSHLERSVQLVLAIEGLVDALAHDPVA